MPGVISLSRERDRFPAFAPGHDRPRHSSDLVGERDSCDLCRSPCQQCGEPGSMPGAMDFGIADDGQCAGREQVAQIAIASLANVAEPVPQGRSRSVLGRGRSRPRSPALTGTSSDQRRWQPEQSPIPDRCPVYCRAAGLLHWIGAKPLSYDRTVGSEPQHPQLGAESSNTGAGNVGQPLIACIGSDLEQLFDTIASDRRNDPNPQDEHE